MSEVNVSVINEFMFVHLLIAILRIFLGRIKHTIKRKQKLLFCEKYPIKKGKLFSENGKASRKNETEIARKTLFMYIG